MQTRRIWKEKNRDKINTQEKNRRHSNPDKFKEITRNQQAKWRKNLDDNYIKSQIASKYKIKQKDVDTWMIPVKRAIIQLRRKIKEIQENESENN